MKDRINYSLPVYSFHNLRIRAGLIGKKVDGVNYFNEIKGSLKTCNCSPSQLFENTVFGLSIL